MMINDEIEYLHKVITQVKTGSVLDLGTFDRLFAISIISAFNHINIHLAELYEDLDVSLRLEGLSIDFERYLNPNYWTKNFLFADKYAIYEAAGGNLADVSYKKEINYITDYLPPVVEDGEGFKQAQVDSFKTAMHQFCDEEKLAYRDISHGLHFGLYMMLELLEQIRNKVQKPAKHQYIKLWDDLYEDNKFTDAKKNFNLWKDDQGEMNINILKARQKQEIFNLLTSGFFRFHSSPTGSEVKRCQLKINEDDLPVGTEIPANLHVECAKMEKFIEWKGKHILSLNYEKLGNYIYHYYKKLEPGNLYDIVYFDQTLDLIHEEMSKLNGGFKQFLKDYESNLVNDIYNDCSAILNSCRIHLKPALKDSFLKDFLSKILYDKTIMQEVRSKLVGKPRNKYICFIVYTLYDFYVFKADSVKNDLINTLSKAFGRRPSSTSISRYFKEFQKKKDGALYEWTRNHIDEFKKLETQSTQG